MLNAINNQAYFLISYFCKVNHFKEKFYLYLGNQKCQNKNFWYKVCSINILFEFHIL